MGDHHQESAVLQKEYSSSRRTCHYQLKGEALKRAFPCYVCISKSVYDSLPTGPVELSLNGKVTSLGFHIKQVTSDNLNTAKDELLDTSNSVFRRLFLDNNIRTVLYFKYGEFHGFRVSNIEKDSPIYNIGIHSGDVIKTINGYPLRTPDELLKAEQECRNKSKMVINLDRFGSIKQVSFYREDLILSVNANKDIHEVKSENSNTLSVIQKPSLADRAPANSEFGNSVLSHADANQLLTQADSAYKNGNISQAIFLYQTLIQKFPGQYRESYLKLGSFYFEKKKYDEATVIYRNAMEYFKNDCVILNNMGGSLLAQGEIDAAIDAFQKAKNCKTNYVEPVYNLACAYARKGDKIAARESLKMAVHMNPKVKDWARNDPDLESLKYDARGTDFNN